MTPEELQRLFDKFLAGRETDAERQQLDAILQSDAEAQELLGSQIAFDGLLTDALREKTGYADIAVDPMAVPRHVTRRKFSWRIAVASILGVGVPGLVAASYATEADRLRTINTKLDADRQRLQTTLVVIQKLIGAFALAGDAPDGSSPGPGAVLSGTDVVTVAGYLDPEIIRQVTVTWDAEDIGKQTEVIFPSDIPRTTQIAGLIPFSVQHTMVVRPGRVTSVVVKAEAVETADKILKRIQQDKLRLQRHASFLGSEYGLVVKPANQWLMTNLLPDTVIKDEFLLLEGNVFVDGNLAVCHQASDGKIYLLASSIAITRNTRLTPLQLDFGFLSNGKGAIRMLQISDKTAQTLRAVPLDQPLPEIIPFIDQVVVPIDIQLPSTMMRAAQYVINAGGAVKFHGSQQSIREVSKIDPQAQIQEVDLSYCRVAFNLKQLRGLRQLQSLKLPGVRVTDADLDGIAKQNPEIRWLELSDTAITDLTVTRELVRYSHLVMLGLSSNKQITNASVEAIASHLVELEDLSLRATSVTSVRLLKTLPELKALHIQQTPIAQAELDELKTALPELTIER